MVVLQESVSQLIKFLRHNISNLCREINTVRVYTTVFNNNNPIKI